MALRNEHQLLNNNYPVVIRNKISQWEVFKYNIDDWCDLFHDKVFNFRQGNKEYKETPYWEQLCDVKDLTLKNFFEISQQNQESWLYLDYQHVKNLISDEQKEKFCKSIKWDDLGLPTISGEDSTLWIGSKGAHTPCHMDTYGCNFVAQIFGRKMWILMPPEEANNLNPIRVPYEESSIYSSINFYTPNNNLLKIKKAFKIILSPGDVLFVPRHWWHYVENLEVAITINAWISMEIDHESRLEESIVRHFVSDVCQNLKPEEAKQLLNPSEFKLLEETDTFDIVKKCIENVKIFRKEKKPFCQELLLKKKDFDNFLQENILNLESYITEKSEAHNYNPSTESKFTEKLNDRILKAKHMINSYCHPQNVALVKEDLLLNLHLFDANG